MLHEFITINREEIVLRCRAKVAARSVPHGHDLLRQGFTLAQVVHDYGDICQSITELALEQDAPIGTDDFRTLNRCLDDAIAGAVTEFGRRGSARTGHSESGAVAQLASLGLLDTDFDLLPQLGQDRLTLLFALFEKAQASRTASRRWQIDATRHARQ